MEYPVSTPDIKVGGEWFYTGKGVTSTASVKDTYRGIPRAQYRCDKYRDTEFIYCAVERLTVERLVMSHSLFRCHCPILQLTVSSSLGQQAYTRMILN